MRLGATRWIGAAAAVAVVMGLTVGGVVAVKMAGGGGPQPESVLPGNAMAFAKLDLNPSAGQKVAAYRLASKFPRIKNKMTSEETSIKEALFGSIFTGPTSESGFGLDYKTDVEPWLGDRIGVGVFPDMSGDKQPDVGIAVAVTDEKAAKIALDKAIANMAKKKKSSPKLAGLDMPVSVSAKPMTTGYAFTAGFVILSESTAIATKLVETGKTNTLADSKYAEDVDKLDSDQIGVAWADIGAVVKAIPKDKLGKSDLGLPSYLSGVADPTKASGRVVVGLHADPSFIEVTAKGIDLKGTGTPAKSGTGAALIASFPADVFGAVSVTGLGKQVATLYTEYAAKNPSAGLDAQLNKVGIRSPKELETLLGAETGMMISGTALTQSQMQLAVRTRSNEADAALAIVRRAMGAPGAGSVTTAKVTGPDGIVVAMGSDLGAALSAQSGSKLGSTEAFKQVIPNADGADFAAYVDLTKLIPMAIAMSPSKTKDPDMESMKTLKALGMTATGGSEPSFQLRLSFK